MKTSLLKSLLLVESGLCTMTAHVKTFKVAFMYLRLSGEPQLPHRGVIALLRWPPLSLELFNYTARKRNIYDENLQMTMMEGHRPNDVRNERGKWTKKPQKFRILEERSDCPEVTLRPGRSAQHAGSSAVSHMPFHVLTTQKWKMHS